jgi:hypothetical protein
MRRQRTHHAQTIPTSPTAHRAKTTSGSALFSGGVAAISGGESTETENGCTMWLTAGGTFDRTGAVFQSIRLLNAIERGGCEPQPLPHPSSIRAQRQRRQSRNHGERGGLPEMVQDAGGSDSRWMRHRSDVFICPDMREP